MVVTNCPNLKRRVTARRKQIENEKVRKQQLAYVDVRISSEVFVVTSSKFPGNRHGKSSRKMFCFPHRDVFLRFGRVWSTVNNVDDSQGKTKRETTRHNKVTKLNQDNTIRTQTHTNAHKHTQTSADFRFQQPTFFLFIHFLLLGSSP